MKNQKQLSFLKPQNKFHGGALLYKKRKSIRPLTSKDAIHFVLRSQWAMGRNSFLMTGNRKGIERILLRFSKKFGVRIYQQAINSNHIHLLLRITNRVLYRAFIKAVSGKIASHIMGNQSFKDFSKNRMTLKRVSRAKPTMNQRPCDGSPSQNEFMPGDSNLRNQLTSGDGSKDQPSREGFWQFRPFSRITNWGKDFKTCVKYLKQNTLEALGFVPYTQRKNYYSKWLQEVVPEIRSI